MFSDRLRIKALVISFLCYVIVSVVLFAMVVQVWMPPGIAAGQLRKMAESDGTLLMWQDILGTVLGVFAGYIACRMSGATGLRNSLAVGALLILYGVLGIFLHPGHPVAMQIAKLVSPIPLALAGGWLAMKHTHQT